MRKFFSGVPRGHEKTLTFDLGIVCEVTLASTSRQHLSFYHQVIASDVLGNLLRLSRRLGKAKLRSWYSCFLQVKTGLLQDSALEMSLDELFSAY